MANRKRKGNCFEASALQFLAMDREAVLVHGAPWSEKHQVRIAHAWIEYTETNVVGEYEFQMCAVLDATLAKDKQLIPAPLYYMVGRMSEAHVIRYTREQARVLMVETENYGPWTGPASGAVGRDRDGKK